MADVAKAPPKRVAVIGGGLAGLSAAVHLAQGGAVVDLYEASDHLGGAVFPASDLPFAPRLSPWHPATHPSLLTFAERNGVPLRAFPGAVAVLGGEAGEVLWRTGEEHAAVTALRAALRKGLEAGGSLVTAVDSVLEDDAHKESKVMLALLIRGMSDFASVSVFQPLTEEALAALPFDHQTYYLPGNPGDLVEALVSDLAAYKVNVHLETPVTSVKGFPAVVNGSVSFDAVVVCTGPESAVTFLETPSEAVHLALHTLPHLHLHATLHATPGFLAEVAATYGQEDEEEDGGATYLVVAHPGHISTAVFGVGAGVWASRGRVVLPPGAKLRPLGRLEWTTPTWSPNAQRAARVLATVAGEGGMYFTGAGMRATASKDEAYAGGRAAAEAVMGKVLGGEPAVVRRAASKRTARLLNYKEARPGGTCMGGGHH